jgi:hypothetical protein
VYVAALPCDPREPWQPLDFGQPTIRLDRTKLDRLGIVQARDGREFQSRLYWKMMNGALRSTKGIPF